MASTPAPAAAPPSTARRLILVIFIVILLFCVAKESGSFPSTLAYSVEGLQSPYGIKATEFWTYLGPGTAERRHKHHWNSAPLRYMTICMVRRMTWTS